MSVKTHWEEVYRKKDPATDVSWHQSTPAASLKLIHSTGLGKDEPIIDIGGGASLLVDGLLNEGYTNLAVLDISDAALRHAQGRLGVKARAVAWLSAEVASFVPPHPFKLWHDRATFHFQVTPGARRRYVRSLKRAVLPGGHVLIGAFAKDGPDQCSGLPVMRHDADSLRVELGSEFDLIEQLRETHLTPWGTRQNFAWFHFQRRQHSKRANSRSSKALETACLSPRTTRNAISNEKPQ